MGESARLAQRVSVVVIRGHVDTPVITLRDSDTAQLDPNNQLVSEQNV